MTASHESEVDAILYIFVCVDNKITEKTIMWRTSFIPSNQVRNFFYNILSLVGL